jgi:hypothetical protein
VHAQKTLEIPLQLDFVNPGAKSLALGGAFAGVADDATASFANPAGLTLLGMPELSVEIRRTRATTTSLERGRLSGTLTGVGVDTDEGPIFGESSLARYGLRYLSVVYPLPSHQWVLAAYRHELARVDQRLDSSGVLQRDQIEAIDRREPAYAAERFLQITGYGGSVAYKLRRNVSIGGAIAVYRFSLDSAYGEYTVPTLYAEPNYDEHVQLRRQDGGGNSVAPTVGVTVDRGRARLGVVYRHGASFTYTAEEGSAEARDVKFRVPHTLAVGLSMRVTPQFLVAGEVTRIAYSRLVDDFVTEQALSTGQPAAFSIDDGTEFHVALQYAPVRQGAPVRLRVGTWYDPDHSVHFRPSRTPASVKERLEDERLSAALGRGKSEVHVSGGVGVTLSRAIDFNAGIDASASNFQFSASAVMRLGRSAP